LTAPLTDLCVHTRDIERPLGLASPLDPDALRAVLTYVCGGKARGFIPASRTKGLTFEASDLGDRGWAIGAGPIVRGTGEAIMMAVNGRRSALTDLAGDGVPLLANRLT
jgi:hypothetical protein